MQLLAPSQVPKQVLLALEWTSQTSPLFPNQGPVLAATLVVPLTPGPHDIPTGASAVPAGLAPPCSMGTNAPLPPAPPNHPHPSPPAPHR